MHSGGCRAAWFFYFFYFFVLWSSQGSGKYERAHKRGKTAHSPTHIGKEPVNIEEKPIYVWQEQHNQESISEHLEWECEIQDCQPKATSGSQWATWIATGLSTTCGLAEKIKTWFLTLLLFFHVKLELQLLVEAHESTIFDKFGWPKVQTGFVWCDPILGYEGFQIG